MFLFICLILWFALSVFQIFTTDVLFFFTDIDNPTTSQPSTSSSVTNNIDKLTQYNDIILQLTGKNSKEIKKDTKLIEEIKLYLNKSEKEKLNKQIEESKSHQDNYINYIISRLPLV